jgi:hypothetical protein
MALSRQGRHVARLLPLIAAGVAAALAVAPGLPAGAAPANPAGARTQLPTRGVLNDVVMVSARSGWAVGRIGFCHAKTLIERWDGTLWKKVALPASERGIWLDSIAATSASNAWTVGPTNSDTGQSQMLRWNGSAWTQVKLPRVKGGAQLFGVAATSAANAWAVGQAGDGKALILRWNGSAWTRVSNSGPESYLTDVVATSARNAWAVGQGARGGLILHWNGTTWTRTPIVGLHQSVVLYGVTALSARAAWAVGTTLADKAIMVRWNGATWRRVKLPIKGGALLGIAALSGHDAWAVGSTTNTIGSCSGVSSSALMPGFVGQDRSAFRSSSTLFLHWNGHRWQRVKNLSLPTGSALVGIVAISVRRAFAVGGAGGNLGAKAKALVLHWNGKRWQ